MTPALASLSSAGRTVPRRFVGLTLPLGLHGQFFAPEDTGYHYTPSRYLKQVMDLRNDFTVISGSSHPGVGGGHRAEGSLLSAYPNSAGSDTKNSISVDQLMVKHMGHTTRFPSLILNTGSFNSPSYTENGAMIPAEYSIEKLYAKLFIDDTPEEQQRQIKLVKQGRSIMDIVGDEARALKREPRAN